MLKLIVTEPFADFQKGDEITDKDKVAATLETHRAHVVPVNAPDAPAAAKTDKA